MIANKEVFKTKMGTTSTDNILDDIRKRLKEANDKIKYDAANGTLTPEEVGDVVSLSDEENEKQNFHDLNEDSEEYLDEVVIGGEATLNSLEEENIASVKNNIMSSMGDVEEEEEEEFDFQNEFKFKEENPLLEGSYEEEEEMSPETNLKTNNEEQNAISNNETIPDEEEEWEFFDDEVSPPKNEDKIPSNTVPANTETTELLEEPIEISKQDLSEISQEKPITKEVEFEEEDDVYEELEEDILDKPDLEEEALEEEILDNEELDDEILEEELNESEELEGEILDNTDLEEEVLEEDFDSTKNGLGSSINKFSQEASQEVLKKDMSQENNSFDKKFKEDRPVERKFNEDTYSANSPIFKKDVLEKIPNYLNHEISLEGPLMIALTDKITNVLDAKLKSLLDLKMQASERIEAKPEKPKTVEELFAESLPPILEKWIDKNQDLILTKFEEIAERQISDAILKLKK